MTGKIPVPLKNFTLLLYLTLLVLQIFGVTREANGQGSMENGKIFSMKNLSAWCIVPFDNKKRGPEERAGMLNSLGITKFAYDWREEHVSSFDEEMDALKKHHIELKAFWMPYGADPAKSKHYKEILALLQRHHLKTQLWWSYGSSDDELKNMSQREKVIFIGRMVQVMATDAARIGCSVGLYNHGGWFGEPENQLAIIKYLKMPNVGIVYNFNHAETQIARFPSFFPKILPHLIALNLAGLKNGEPAKVVPIGQGDSEKGMIRIIGKSAYNGTIGIINEDTDPDAEVGLKLNIEGLKSVAASLGYKGFY